MDDMIPTQDLFRETSLEDLSCQLVTTLEQECLNKLHDVQQLTAHANELKSRCPRQAENNKKQSVDLERLKVMIHINVENREACLKKNAEQREKCQTVQNCLKQVCDLINKMNESKENMATLYDKLSERIISEINNISKCQQFYCDNLSLADKVASDLQKQKELDKMEFEEGVINGENVISEEQNVVNELLKQIQAEESECKEEAVMIKLLTPQNEEMNEQLNNLYTQVSSKREHVDSEKTRLQTALEEDLKMKEQLIDDLTSQENMMHEIICNTTTKDSEIKGLDIALKDLVVREDELSKVHDCQMEQLNQLQPTSQTLNTTLNRLLDVQKENISLNEKLKQLITEEEDYDTKIQETLTNENLQAEAVENLTQDIKRIVETKTKSEEEKLILDQNLNQVINEIDNENAEFVQLRASIETHHQKEIDKQESLRKTIEGITLQIVDLNKEIISYKTAIEETNTCLKSVKDACEESDSKLSLFLESCERIRQSLTEEEVGLIAEIAQAEQELEQARLDLKRLQSAKEEISLLENEYECRCQSYEQEVQLLKDSFNKQVEDMKTVSEEERMSYNNILIKLQQVKNYASVEIKENTVTINDQEMKMKKYGEHQKQKEKTLASLDKIINNLEDKLKNVRHLAASDSQVSANQTPQCQLGGPSSADTFLLSDEKMRDTEKNRFKRIHHKQKPNYKKKKIMPVPNDDVTDFWGF